MDQKDVDDGDSSIECRVCLQLISKHAAFSLFSSMNTKDEANVVQTIVDVIRSFADVTMVLDDGRSKYVCLDCLNALESGIRLQQRIRENERTLRTSLDYVELLKPMDENEYKLEYLDEFKEEIAAEKCAIMEPKQVLEMIDETANHENDERLSPTLTFQISEEEMECLQDGLPEQGKFEFEMPPAELIAQRITFYDFEYLEILGDRCCGCAHIAPSRDALMIHAKEVHSQNYYADSSYTCPTCYQKFSTEESLAKHTQYYSYSDVFLCTVCQESFNFRSHLELHLKQEHHQQQVENDGEIEQLPSSKKSYRKISGRLLSLPDEKVIKETRDFPQYRQHLLNGERCCGCGLYFESVDPHVAEVHPYVVESVKAEEEDALKCQICRQAFASVRDLWLHVQERKRLTHIYECRLCKDVFEKKHLLIKHLQGKSHHSNVDDGSLGIDLSREIDANQEGSVSVSVSNIESFYCCFRRCKEEYATEAGLLAHAHEVHSGRRKENEIKFSVAPQDATHSKCLICLRVFETEAKLAQHRAYKMQLENHNCHFCGRTFMKNVGLREHQEREHLNLPPRFRCEICGKHFITSSTLNQHRRVHGPFKSCPCLAEGCNMVFRDERLMRRHYRNVHTEVKPYACQHCQKMFRAKEALDIHLRSHTGEKPYPCRHEGCDKRFSHGTDRMRHERSVHTGERPHKCLVCSASFLRKRDLRIHNEKMHLNN